MIIKAPPLVTAEELLEMPNSIDYELFDGILVERQMGAESNAIAVELAFFIRDYFKKFGRTGHIFMGEAGFRIFPDRPNLIRKPDLAFVKFGRLPDDPQRPKGHVSLVPDLAMESISPGDLASEVNEKIDEYVEARIPLIWFFDPDSKTVQVFRKDGSTQRLTEADEISGEDILPNFRCRVADIFAPPEPSGPSTVE
ncbi:MAG: Uma2 family endonuclease [Pirellulaceae bacterium]